MTASEAYWALSDMVTDLDQIAAAACDLLESDDGKAALSILMVILEETSNEYDMFDDSNGELGFFLGDLGLPLAEAFVSSTLEENEIEAIYQRLESINTRLEKYEIQGLEVALSATRHGWQPVESTEIDEAKLNILERQGRTDDPAASRA